MKIGTNKLALILVGLLFLGNIGLAQTAEFTYQGKLLDNSLPPTASYDFQFSLWDASANGTQIGTTQTVTGVAVASGIFTVKLDFGAAAYADGGLRFLQVELKPSAGGTYTTVTPRQAITSAPYAVKSIKSNDADNLGGVAASEYVTTSSVDGTFIKNDTASQTANFNVTGSGVVGTSLAIGTASPAAGFTFHSVGSGKVQAPNGEINLSSPNGETGVTILPNTGGRADIRFNSATLVMAAGTNTNVPANTGVAVDTGGNVGIGGLPQSGVRFNSVGIGRFQLPNGVIQLGSPNSETGITITGTHRADIRFNNEVLVMAAGFGTTVPANTGVAVDRNGNVGIGTINPATRLDVVGTVKTSILQITGGSDLAENFEFSEEIKPGMVVAIDPRNVGKLAVARGAYNRQVAGIISGANDLAAGMTLPDVGKSGKGKPVALSGRVWAYADARKYPIRPGDMLTTSNTPGFAMRAVNLRRAQGAIIGKAMTELGSGTGMILVLVNLQ